MPGRYSPHYVVCVLVLGTSPVLAQRVRDVEPLPKDLDALVALMAGEHLPSAAQKRGISDTPGSRAAAALLSRRDDAVPALARGLESPDQSIRLNAVYVLSLIGTPATLPLRIKTASDANPQVRAQAVASLPAYASDEARRALLIALKDPDPAVRNAALRAFRPRAEEKVDSSFRFATANVLIPLLEDPATQYAAVDVLGQLGMNVAARPMLKLLKAPDKEIRWAVVEALGQMKDKQIAVELTAALRDEDPHVRMYASRALGQIGDLRTTPALVDVLSDKEPFVRRDAAAALGQIGDLRAVPSLFPLLEDPDEQVRSAAAGALGQIGDVRAVEPLSKLLVRNGRDNSAVARALGHLRDPRAIEPLTRYLLAPAAGPDDSREAADALAQIRHPNSVAALMKVTLTTRDSDVRHNARRAFGDLTGVSFSHEPNETIATWWALNREHYLRPLPEKK